MEKDKYAGMGENDRDLAMMADKGKSVKKEAKKESKGEIKNVTPIKKDK